MKKFVLIGLCLLLALAFAACSESESGGGNTGLTCSCECEDCLAAGACDAAVCGINGTDPCGCTCEFQFDCGCKCAACVAEGDCDGTDCADECDCACCSPTLAFVGGDFAQQAIGSLPLTEYYTFPEGTLADQIPTGVISHGVTGTALMGLSTSPVNPPATVAVPYTRTIVAAGDDRIGGNALHIEGRQNSPNTPVTLLCVQLLDPGARTHLTFWMRGKSVARVPTLIFNGFGTSLSIVELTGTIQPSSHLRDWSPRIILKTTRDDPETVANANTYALRNDISVTSVTPAMDYPEWTKITISLKNTPSTYVHAPPGASVYIAGSTHKLPLDTDPGTSGDPLRERIKGAWLRLTDGHGGTTDKNSVYFADFYFEK